jgi:arylsulfatase A-like enzyme
MTGRSRYLALAAGVLGVFVAGLLVLWLLRGGGGARFRGDTAGANVLLITVDTLRADRLGAYGNPEASTPVIDALAARGARFENAVTPAVMTLPSHASIMTGTLPPAHGIRDNGDHRLAPGALTLAEVLRSRGMRTGAVTGAFVLDSMFGLDQGFEHYDDTMPPRAANEAFLAERSASHVTDAAIRFLNTVAGSRFFIWVHYFDPHQPYAAPAGVAGRFAGRPYDAEVPR